MQMRILVLALATALTLASLRPAQAILIELDPATQVVNVGDAFAVDLNISGLGAGAAPSLGAWDVDIGFDPTILGLASVTFGDPVLGNQLDLSGFGSINGASPLGGVVDLFEVSLDPAFILDTLQAGAFTLATLAFDALGAGTSALSLTVDALSDSLGLPLDATANGASVTVSDAVVISEPATWALFMLGLATLVVVRRQFGD